MQPAVALDTLLGRSEQLERALLETLQDGGYALFDDSTRLRTAFSLCNLSLEHAAALRMLVAAGLAAAALALLRPQYETLLRAAWTLYAAHDEQVEVLSAPLTVEAARAAKKLPALGDMLKALERSPAPQTLRLLLREFSDQSTETLNSFVHGGIHPLRRASDGFPGELLARSVCFSNALAHLSATLLATLTGNPGRVRVVQALYVEFTDCLPMRE
jgi:hypothetical protein